MPGMPVPEVNVPETTAAVVNLMEGLGNQGYVVFTDNYYTSTALADILRERGIELVGTCRTNRAGFPHALRNVKEFERHGQRGDMRYVRQGGILYQQWLDKRVVTMLSTYHKGDEPVLIERHTKAGGHHVELLLLQPESIRDYNHGMGGVDSFDQRASTYSLLRKTRKYWKSIFFDLLEVAIVNSCILFTLWRRQNPAMIERPVKYSHEDFRAALVRQLAGIQVDDPVPLHHPGPRQQHQAPVHLAEFTQKSRNCHRCYAVDKKERKCQTRCATCQKYLHTNHRNCFLLHHQ